ncbi:MAG TPA: sensor histidine kinase [Bryobacteraceae bacterium]|nr:sensor histidine kinase [Bryobacteraceae bacterium]
MLQPQDLLTLLLKVAVAASLASILSRFGAFQRMLVSEERTIGQRTRLALSIAAPFAFGVGTRVFNPTYQAVDLGLEGSMVAGLIGGYYSGLLSGILISLPAMLNGELMTMPLYAGIGVLGGLLRDVAPDKEDIWRFSPFLDLSVYRLLRRRYDVRRSAFHLACLLSIVAADLLRFAVANVFEKPRPVFCLAQLWHSNARPLEILAIYIASIFAVTLPLKIWNNFRNEKKLESQQLRLNEARLAALTRQINPHFLFNTLNTVASLIRTNPEEARRVIYKLSSILRALLRKTENFSPLGEELAFIDNYMAIELVRFGDKLRFVKEIDPATVDLLVPSMLLQPLIENSLRHGLGSKIEGGTVRLQSRIEDGRLHLLVEDDGVGIPENRLASLFDQGIGISNVNERLKVLFGATYRMWIDSRPGEGTRTGIEIPELSHPLAAVS